MTVSIVIVDDQEVIRAGLRVLLKEADFDIVGEASSAPEAVSITRKSRPDVVLLDVRLGTRDVDRFTCLRRIREKSPDTAVVMFSAYDNPTYIAQSVALGASDYILKGSSRRDLISAIRSAAKGRTSSATGAMRAIADVMCSRDVTDNVALSKRETQVLRHLAFGLSNKEISYSLHISIETVKEHVKNILRKLEAIDRTQAAVWALHMQLV